MTRNIFSALSDLGMTSTAYIVGSGPNGVPFIPQIPTDCFSLAVNGAIDYDYPFKAHMIWSESVENAHWDLKRRPDCPVIAGYNLARSGVLGYEPEYDFDYLPLLYDTPQDLLPLGRLAGGATIAGCAAQLLFHAGCVLAVLVGIDMGGSLHCDGSPTHEPEGVWHQCNILYELCTQCWMKGMKVVCATQSRLALPILGEVIESVHPGGGAVRVSPRLNI